MILSKRVAGLGAALLLAAGLCACSSSSSTNGLAAESAQQQADTSQLEAVIPLPNFPFSQIKQNLVDIEAINALGIRSTTFFFVQGIDHPIFSCISTGVPIPATDQLSNPLQVQWKTHGSDGIAGVTLGQEEPEGIYTGDTSGTYSLCNDTQGKQFEGYDEAYTVSFTASAHWDTTLKMIVVDGAEVMPVCKIHTFFTTNSSGQRVQSANEVCTDPTHPGNGTNVGGANSTTAYVKVGFKRQAGLTS